MVGNLLRMGKQAVTRSHSKGTTSAFEDEFGWFPSFPARFERRSCLFPGFACVQA